MEKALSSLCTLSLTGRIDERAHFSRIPTPFSAIEKRALASEKRKAEVEQEQIERRTPIFVFLNLSLLRLL